MMYSSIPLAHTLVTLCKSYGFYQVVISPGSRNAPLTLAFSGDPFFECYSIVDERSAAFFALGLGQQGEKPAILVCTSGSALLNYYPAVAEAYYSRIPLVVLSADRPSYKIDIGDGQTIRQDGIFEKHIGFQANLLQDVTHASEAIRWQDEEPPATLLESEQLQKKRQAGNQSAIDSAFETAMQQRLPVHLNAPFEEPLYNMQADPPVEVGKIAKIPPKSGQANWEPLLRAWEKADRKMILIGALPPDSIEMEILDRLGEDPSILVFTETTSNIHHPEFFPSIDTILAPIEQSDSAGTYRKNLRPEILLTLGGMVVSKKIKQFLRRYAPQAHWHIDPFTAPDTFYCLQGHIQMRASNFFTDFLSQVSRGTQTYKTQWDAVKENFRERRKAYLKEIPFTDFQAFNHLLKRIPKGMQVQLANSSTVRYAQLFEMYAENPVYCNRGTSGIEGSLSTAVGAAVNFGPPTLLITGDLSFFYDINGLWNDYLRADFRIVVINNGGGGIFRILPGKTENQDFETYFETVQNRSIEAVCKAFGIGYTRADTPEKLVRCLETFYEISERPELLEIQTPRKLNDSVLLEYFDFLSWSLPNNH